MPPDVHDEKSLTAIEWLCQVSQTIAANSEQHPVAALRDRQLTRIPGNDLMHAVIRQLKVAHVLSRTTEGDLAPQVPAHGVSAIALAIDFILDSSPKKTGLQILAQ